jgi:hypothetical protein
MKPVNPRILSINGGFVEFYADGIKGIPVRSRKN